MERTPIKLLRSASAATVSQAWRIGVTLLTYMALRRVIPPEEMGTWNWALALFVLLAQIRDVGVPGHVVRLEKRPYGSYLRLQLLWGGVFAVLLTLGAPWIARINEGQDPELVPMLRWLALFLFIQGLSSVPLTYFEAEQKIQRTIPAELARNTLFAVLALALVWNGWGVRGIVAAHLAGAAAYTAMLWLSARREMPLEHEPGGTLELVGGAWPLAIMSLLELAVLQLDVLILGLVLLPAAVAKADLAILAVFFLSRQIADAIGRALYPALARYRNEPERAFEAFRVVTVFMVTLVAPGAFFFHFNAEAVALFLGGDTWTGAADYLRVAAFVPFIRPLTMFGREFLLVVHRDRLLLAYTLVNLVSLSGLGLLLVRTNLQEVGMAVAGYFPLGTLLLAWGLYQIDGRGFLRLCRNCIVAYTVTACVFLPLFLVQWGMWPTLAASIALGAAAFGVLSFLHRDDALAFFRGS